MQQPQQPPLPLPAAMNSTWQEHQACDWSWTAPGLGDEHAVCIQHRARFTLPGLGETIGPLAELLETPGE